MTFPVTDPRKFPLPLEEVLRRLQARGLLRHLLLVKVEKGYQANLGRADNNAAASHAIADDPIEAILRACAPGYGHSWSEVLGEDVAPLFDHGAEDDDVDAMIERLL